MATENGRNDSELRLSNPTQDQQVGKEGKVVD